MKENKKEENKGKQATGKVMSNYRKWENREINEIKGLKKIHRDSRYFAVLLFISDIGRGLLNQREWIGCSWHVSTGVLKSNRINWAQATTRAECKNGFYSVHKFRTS